MNEKTITRLTFHCYWMIGRNPDDEISSNLNQEFFSKVEKVSKRDIYLEISIPEIKESEKSGFILTERNGDKFYCVREIVYELSKPHNCNGLPGLVKEETITTVIHDNGIKK